MASFTSTKLLWLKTYEPEAFAKMEHVALPHDYLNYCLTGTYVTYRPARLTPPHPANAPARPTRSCTNAFVHPHARNLDVLTRASFPIQASW